MTNILISFLFMVLFFGCATPSIGEFRAANRDKISKLSLEMGLTKQEIFHIMGTKEIKAMGLTITNPYRSEILTSDDRKTFEVLYYYTEVRKADDNISDDELTPLVFEDNKLIGWGWNFLYNIVEKYEIVFEKKT